jgi:predicted enzyme related to lactoylglutathione lyase
MEPKHNVAGWFNIPVMNMDRAVRFYESVFGLKLERHNVGQMEMAWFPWVENGTGAGGSLSQATEFFQPRDNGILVFLTASSGDLAFELSRIEEAGGKIIQPKTLITEEIGYMAICLDSEGNRIAMHSKK